MFIGVNNCFSNAVRQCLLCHAVIISHLYVFAIVIGDLPLYSIESTLVFYNLLNIHSTLFLYFFYSILMKSLLPCLHQGQMKSSGISSPS